MNLKLRKIERSEDLFSKHLNQLGIRSLRLKYIFEDTITLQYLNPDINETRELILLFDEERIIREKLYDNMNNEIEIRLIDLSYVSTIKNFILSYKDEIENNYNADFVDIKNIINKEVCVYQIDDLKYIYQIEDLIIIMKNYDIINIYDNEGILYDNISLNDETLEIVEEIKFLQKQYIEVYKETPFIIKDHEKYINKEYLIELIQNNLFCKIGRSNKINTLLMIVLGALGGLSLFLGSEQIEYNSLFSFLLSLLSEVIIIDFMIYITFIIIKGQIFFKFHYELLNRNNLYIRNSSYIKYSDVKPFLEKHNVKLIEPKIGFNTQSNISKEVDEIAAIRNITNKHNANNSLLYDYSHTNLDILNKTKELLTTIKNSSLEDDNTIIFTYYIPTLNDFIKEYNNLNDIDKSRVRESIELLNNKLENIINENKNRYDLELSSEIQAFYNSLK